eukprot:TRINITY_DN7468_c0_g1_i1.p2 TRINITY_DN7468_c0_g1~~TRINITY_DN7468_c0_g1_i1.p2  ORF type:complete len:156 (+),score=33.28 TRINITY_DN7468_c0_g1_i1:1072-1539(+)
MPAAMKVTTKALHAADALMLLDGAILMESVYAYYLNGVLFVLLLRLGFLWLSGALSLHPQQASALQWRCFALYLVLCEIPWLWCAADDAPPAARAAVINFMRHEDAFSCTRLFIVDAITTALQISSLAARYHSAHPDTPPSFAFAGPSPDARDLI